MTAPASVPTIYNIEADSGKLSLNLHEGQSRAWQSTARIVAVISGTQGGKTSFGGWWLWREIQQQGAGDYLAVAPTYSLFKLKLLPELRNIFEHILNIGRYWSSAQVIELCDPETGHFWAERADDPMWGRIILRSAVAKGGLESATAQAAWLDEAGQDDFSKHAWEAVLRRLSLNRGRVLITTTPYNLGWLKVEIYDRWKAGDPSIDVIQFTSLANPAFSREEYKERKAKMDNWRFRMFYGGQFERPAGLIYSAFADAYRDNYGHKVKPFDLDPAWNKFIGIDPGGANNAFVMAAHDHVNDIYYIYDEMLLGGLSTPQLYSKLAIKTLGYKPDPELQPGPPFVAYYIGQQAESQQRRDWRQAGANNVQGPPHNDLEAGIDSVIEWLRTYKVFIFDTCTGIIGQLNEYRRVLDNDNIPTDKIHQKEKFHYLDAFRYLAVGRSEPPAGDIRELPRR